MSTASSEKFFKNYKKRLKIHYEHNFISHKKDDRQSNYNLIENSNQMIQIASAVGYQCRAIAHIGNGDLNKAIADLDAVIYVLPDSFLPYEYRGAVYGEKGEYDKSLIDLNKAVQLKPDHADSYYYRSLAYLGKGDFKKALADCNKALKFKFVITSAKLDTYILRGYLHGMDSNFQKAITDFKAALRIKLDDFEEIFHDSAKECLKYAQQEVTEKTTNKKTTDNKKQAKTKKIKKPPKKKTAIDSMTDKYINDFRKMQIK